MHNQTISADWDWDAIPSRDEPELSGGTAEQMRTFWRSLEKIVCGGILF